MRIGFVNLARGKLRKLLPGQVVTERGISFERLNNGDGVYTINIMVDGERIHRVVGRESDGTTRTHAEQLIEKLRRDARDGRLNLPKRRKTALRFVDAADKYLENLEAGDGRDVVMKRARLNHHLKPFFGEMPLAKIATLDIERYKKQRLQEPAKRGGFNRKGRAKKVDPSATAKPSTVNRELATLSHLFNKAIEWGWTDRRPAQIRRLREQAGRIVYLTVDQIRALLEAAGQDDNLHLYPFIRIGLATGMRTMEILSIRIEHVNLERLVIFVPKAKAGAREQPITKDLADYLQKYIADLAANEEWLFPSATSKSGHLADIRKAFRRAVTAAKMNPDQVVRHTLRHTAITHLVQSGVDLPTVKRISGHKTLIMVERYAHQNGEHIRAAMDKLEERYRKVS